jgi:hypothetical protein
MWVRRCGRTAIGAAAAALTLHPTAVIGLVVGGVVVLRGGVVLRQAAQRALVLNGSD